MATRLLKRGVATYTPLSEVGVDLIVNKLLKSEEAEYIQTALEFLIVLLYQVNNRKDYEGNSSKQSFIKRLLKVGCVPLCFILVQHQRGKIASLAERLLALLSSKDIFDR